MLLPMDEKQFAFWKMRRNGSPNITIANLLGISRQAVSKALLVMNEKIESAFREMAHAHKIAIDTINKKPRSFFPAQEHDTIEVFSHEKSGHAFESRREQYGGRI